MRFASLGIRSKLLLGMSILVLGYITTILTGFYKGAANEVRFAELKEVSIPVSLDSERVLFGFDAATKMFDDALMIGDADQVQLATKKQIEVSESLVKLNRTADLCGALQVTDQALVKRIAQLVSEEDSVFKASSSASDPSSREVLRQKADALTKNTVELRKALADMCAYRLGCLTEKLETLASRTRFQRFFDLGLGALVIVISCLIVFLIIQQAIIKNIFSVVLGLKSSASKLDDAAVTISGSSQSLADGASQQAASLEETSATLEEISAMAQRNAESSQTAKERMGQAQTTAEQGLRDVHDLTAAMGEIKTASDNIAKIVKAIDEIAFQTNILALNAAVEAARAGEAGAGFAVVAEEVRNLAQRSAQAARETAQLIEDSIGKSERGVRMSDKVVVGLQDIAMQVREVYKMVSETAQASQEQSSGVSQVNVAVTQLDRLTQSNAATAEESAAAVHELSDQSKELHRCLQDLGHIVYGKDFDAEHADEKASVSAPARGSLQVNRSASRSLGSKSGTPRTAAPALKVSRTGVALQKPSVKADDFFSS